jgi:hypothetical protein
MLEVCERSAREGTLLCLCPGGGALPAHPPVVRTKSSQGQRLWDNGSAPLHVEEGVLDLQHPAYEETGSSAREV